MDYPVENVCSKPARISEVRKALEDLDAVICRYDNTVNKLNDKLSYVMHSEHPINASEKDCEYGAPLANDINNFRLRLRNITDSLESLYERLEI